MASPLQWCLWEQDPLCLLKGCKKTANGLVHPSCSFHHINGILTVLQRSCGECSLLGGGTYTIMYLDFSKPIWFLCASSCQLQINLTGYKCSGCKRTTPLKWDDRILEHVRKRGGRDYERAGKCKAGMQEQEGMENALPWPSPWMEFFGTGISSST